MMRQMSNNFVENLCRYLAEQVNPWPLRLRGLEMQREEVVSIIFEGGQ